MAKQNDSVTRQERDNETAMRADQRFDYSAIVDRKPLKLPRGARMVVWPVVNVEEWEITRPMPRQYSSPPGGQSVPPDVQNWGWHEYGMRVGKHGPILSIPYSVELNDILIMVSLQQESDAMLAYMKKRKDVVFWQGDQIHEWCARAAGA